MIGYPLVKDAVPAKLDKPSAITFGREWQSPLGDHAPVAQLDRASDFGSEGWGFDSLQA
jgi:hypothetical protein